MSHGTFLYGAHVRANGIRQHYLRFGGAGLPALVVLPGITSPAMTWAFVGQTFGRNFDTYVLDIRGRGLSEASDALDYSLDAQARDVDAFARALGLGRYALVGHSMGARIAIRAVRQGAAGVERVALIDPPVSGPGRRPYPSALSWYVDSIAEARLGMDAAAMKVFCPTWTDAQLAMRAEWLHTCDERAIRTSFEGFHGDDIHADLPALALPVLLMTAERGDVVRDVDVEEIRRSVPHLRHVRVPAAGHMIPWDNEAGFHAAFTDFLGARVA